MTGNFITQRDFIDLQKHIEFLRKLPAFIRSLKLNLDLIPARDYGTYRIVELEATFDRAIKQAADWSDLLPALNTFTDELTIASSDILERAQPLLTRADEIPELMARASNTLEALLIRLEAHQDTLGYLTKGIYQVLPRVYDFITANLYRHARQHGLMVIHPDMEVALQRLTSVLNTPVSPAIGSAEARLEGARRYALITQRAYADAYGAADNLGSYLGILGSIIESAFIRTLRVTRLGYAQHTLELRLMLSRLNDVHRLSRNFNEEATKSRES